MMKFGVMLACGLAAMPATSFAAEVTAAKIDLSKEDQVVCRKTTDTGSLVRATKICKTRKAWRVGSENARREMEQLTGGAPPKAN